MHDSPLSAPSYLRTWIELDRAALLQNLSTVAQIAHPARVGVVVKANAYGHGLREVATILEADSQVALFMVGSIEEGVALRTFGCTKPILCLSSCYGDITEALAHTITLTISDDQMLDAIAKACIRNNATATVHLKMETGMYRLGIEEQQIPHIMHLLTSLPQIQVEGIYTHLSDTNNPDEEHTLLQRKQFDTIARQIDPLHKLYWHTAGSGALYLPSTHDIVRVGTMLYGSWKSERHHERLAGHTLKPILTWKTRIIHCKEVPANGCIGYDRTYQAQRPMRIAILPVGYADGYQRALSNKGVVMIHNSYAPIVGVMSMNLMTVDVTNIPEAAVGSEVMLIGPHKYITPYDIAQQLHSNPNAITAVINPLIPRNIV